MTTTGTAFELQEVSYSYNDVPALGGLSLSIKEGARIAILGANGSGKSTLLRLLGGIYFPESGTISAFGSQLTEERFQDESFGFNFRRRVGLVFQNPDVQLFCPTVFDEVAFGPLQLRWTKAEVCARVGAALSMLEIEHLRDRSPHRLSGGEKKRVALAATLVIDPEVLLLDEPTAALDPKTQSRVLDFLSDLPGGAKTLITATHDLAIVPELADHCVVLQHGRIFREGTPSDVLSDEALLLETNLIHAHRHRHGSGLVHSHPHTHGLHEH